LDVNVTLVYIYKSRRYIIIYDIPPYNPPLPLLYYFIILSSLAIFFLRWHNFRNPFFTCCPWLWQWRFTISRYILFIYCIFIYICPQHHIYITTRVFSLIVRFMRGHTLCRKGWIILEFRNKVSTYILYGSMIVYSYYYGNHVILYLGRYRWYIPRGTHDYNNKECCRLLWSSFDV